MAGQSNNHNVIPAQARETSWRPGRNDAIENAA
jgi:hypothetical protein